MLYVTGAWLVQKQCVMWCRLYQQLQRDKRGLPGLTQSNRRMWESTIEAACRAGRMDWALQVWLCIPLCHCCCSIFPMLWCKSGETCEMTVTVAFTVLILLCCAVLC